jgi:hypothetical protein
VSCDSIQEGRPCTIPGRHDMQHGYQEPATGQWVFWEEEVRHISTRHEPTTEEINDILRGVVQPIRLHQDGLQGEPEPVPATRTEGLSDDEFIPGTTVRNGTHCHGCGQYCAVYRRSLTGATAKAMIALYRRNEGREYVHVKGDRDLSKGKYWDLLEQMPGDGEDGFSLGWWRLSDLGRRFVRGEVMVPKYAHTFDNKRQWYSGDSSVSIHDVLGTNFDYAELFGGG